MCNSDITLTVCKCINGADSCDDFSTCQPKAVPAAAPAAPAVVLSPCEACTQCIKGLQGFVSDQGSSRDGGVQATAFLSKCVSTFKPGDPLGCRNISTAISYSLDGNLAKRAGALCAKLGNCSADVLEGGAARSSCSITIPGVSIGRPDLCAAEGVTGGSMRLPVAGSSEPHSG